MNENAQTINQNIETKDLLAAEFLERRKSFLSQISFGQAKSFDYHDPRSIRANMQGSFFTKDEKLDSILVKREDELTESERHYLTLAELRSSLKLEIIWKFRGINLVLEANDLKPTEADSQKSYQEYLNRLVQNKAISLEESNEKAKENELKLASEGSISVLSQRTESELELISKEKKHLVAVNDVLDSIDLSNTEKSVIQLFRQLIIMTGGGGLGDEPEKMDYATFQMVEQHPLYQRLADVAEYCDDTFRDQWNLRKAQAMERAVWESMGRRGSLGMGFLRDFFDDDRAMLSAGEKKADDAIAEMDKYRRNRFGDPESISHLGVKKLQLRSGRMNELRNQRAALEERVFREKINMNEDGYNEANAELKEFDRNHPNQLFKKQIERELSQKMVDEEFLTEVQKNRNLTDVERIKIWCELVEKNGLNVPRRIASVYEVIRQVENQTDTVELANKRMRSVNAIRLATVFFQTIEGDFDNSQSSPDLSDTQPQDLREAVLDWLVNTPEGHVTAEILEELLLHGMKHFPSESVIMMSTEIEQLLRNPSIDTIKALQQKCVELFRESATDQDDEALSVYDEELRSKLLALEELNNPNYKTGKQLLSSAQEIYQERMRSQGEEARRVYWQRHTESMDMSDLLKIYMGSSGFDGDESVYPMLEENGRENLATIYKMSNLGYSSYGDVLSLYNSINVDQPFSSEEEIKTYFSDYMYLVELEHQSTGSPVPLENIIALALEKNEGNMHLALWDSAIFVKMLTRNNLGSGISSQGDTNSGISTIELLEDPFSENYTAKDVANLLPDYKYWNNPKVEIGVKDYDPSNLAGIDYHILNIIAMQGEFPESAGMAGLLVNWLFDSGGMGEHGSEKFQNQMSWLIRNTGEIGDYLESLPKEPELNEIEDSAELTAILLTSDNVAQLKSVQNGEMWNLLLEGKVVKVTDEEGKVRYASMTGTFLVPRLQLSDVPEFVEAPLTADDVADRGVNQEIPTVSAYEVVDEINHVGIKSIENLSYEEAMDLVNMRKNGQGVLSAEGLVDEVVARDLYSKIMEVDELGTLWIIRSPDIFKGVVTKEWVDQAMMEYPQQFFERYSGGWNEFYSPSEILFKMEEHFPHEWGGFIATDPSAFKEGLQPSHLDRLIEAGGLEQILTHYHDGWSELWPPEVLIAACQKHSDHHVSVFDYPNAFKTFINRDNFTDYLPTADEYYQLLKNYNNGWDAVLTPEEISSSLRQSFPDEWGNYMLDYPEVFKELIKSDDLAELSASRAASLILEGYDEYWRELWAPEELLTAIKDSKPKIWGHYVGRHPEIFKEFINPGDLDSIILSGGSGNILSNYDQFWKELWTPTELMHSIQRSLPERWGEEIGRYPEIFKGVMQHNDLVDIFTSYGDYYVLSHYDEGWNQLWTPAELKAVLLMDNEYGWGAHWITYYPKIFKEVVNTDDINYIVEDLVGFGDYLDFIASYQADWSDKWTPAEIKDAFYRAHPTEATDYIMFIPKLFKDIVNPNDLDVIIKDGGARSILDAYNDGWNEYWSIEEIMMAIKSNMPDTWGAHVGEHPELFKEIIKTDSLPDLVAAGGGEEIIRILREEDEARKLLNEGFSEDYLADRLNGWGSLWTIVQVKEEIRRQEALSDSLKRELADQHATSLGETN